MTLLSLMLLILTREDEQRVGSWEEAGKFYSVPGIRITLTTRQDKDKDKDKDNSAWHQN